jgi:hypothetical protein
MRQLGLHLEWCLEARNASNVLAHLDDSLKSQKMRSPSERDWRADQGRRPAMPTKATLIARILGSNTGWLSKHSDGTDSGRRPTIGQAGGLWKNASDWVKKGVDVRVEGRI